jgi:hypothetical protein
MSPIEQGEAQAGGGHARKADVGRPAGWPLRRHCFRAGYMCRVDFMTRYYADDPDMKYSVNRDNWTAGLSLNWKIFDGFTTKSDRAEALSKQESSRNE